MKRFCLGTLTAVALSFASFALTGAAAADDQSAEAARAQRAQLWAADHQTRMDARLGGMKEALKLTSSQYPLWEAFENAVQTADKARMEDMREMMKNRERVSPADRLDAMADRMARRAAEMKTIAGAAKPFYASLDDAQQRKFQVLGREMMAGSGPMWEDLGGDAGGTWEPQRWDWMK
jgi:hypothetical protein